jgi:hypothetical protein
MVSEEMWMPVRGKSMLGSFRQTRPDGNPAFFEFTQIVAMKDGVVLRQVHLHGRFETDERRKDPMFLKLAKVEGNAATFVPIADGEFGEGSKSHAGGAILAEAAPQSRSASISFLSEASRYCARARTRSTGPW